MPSGWRTALLRAARTAMLTCAMMLSQLPVTAEDGVSDLERYAGDYEYDRGKTLQVVRDGDHLVARPPDGLPAATLEAQAVSGKFAMRGANFVFRFLADEADRVIGLEITRPDGTRHRLPRQIKKGEAVASLRTVTVDADTAVNARVFNNYERRRGPEGTFVTETCTFGEGGLQAANPNRDESIDGMSFQEIAHAIAPALAREGYLFETDPAKTDLLLMVYWGTTTADDHPAVIAEEEADPTRHVFRDRLNRDNARLLGFESVLKDSDVTPLPGAPSASTAHRDLVNALEESRYWVAIVAVDFPFLLKEKKQRPLWSIRYNMRSRGTTFGDALPQMTQVASHFFGRDSKGLVPRGTTGREGTVDYGELTVVEEEEEVPVEGRPQD